jgi:DNA-directed RNA polymerase beta subunit
MMSLYAFSTANLIYKKIDKNIWRSYGCNPYKHSKRVRKNFGKIKLVASMPNLIEIQKNSYEA